MNKETHSNSRMGRLKRPQAPEPRAGRLSAEERLPVETIGPDEASMNMVGAVIEELQVAEEELRAQNEELATARQSIEAERERYKDLFEFAPDGYVVTDAAGIIREANRAASAMLNIPQHWLLGKPFALYLTGAERKTFRAHLSQVQGDKRIREWELHLNPHGRPPLSVALKVAMAQALPGTAIQLRWLLRDITLRKQAEEEWKRLNDQFRLLLESTGEGVYGIDLQGRCTFINKAGATTLGYRPEELYGKLMHQVHHHSRLDGSPYPAEASPIYNSFRSGRACQVDNEIFWRRDGNSFPVHYSTYPIIDGGVIKGAVVTFTDITERKRAEEASARLAAIVGSSDDAIIDKTLDGIVVSWNRGAERIFGYSAEEIIGKPVTVLIPPGRADEEPEIIERLKQGERVEHYETVRRRKDGREIHVSLTISPIKDARGQIIGASRIARDITEHKQAEEEIRRANQELAAVNAELETFSYSVSHDLRAPLRAMRGFAQALLEDYANRLDSVAKDYAQRIVKAARRMDTLMQDLLAYSRLSNADLHPQPVSLSAIVAEAQAQLKEDLQERKAQLTVEEPLPQVVGHPAILVQVVANLLANAAKFVAPRVLPQVRVWAEKRGQRTRLWVEDNGIGIKSEHQGRIFRVFERLHGIETYQGTGIGLAIVRKGIERMGGFVGVESEPGRGSRFWIELP